jgi:hypothetical protein
VRVRRPDEIHRNVRVDEDHASGPSRYPAAISASIWSMSGAGKS